MDGMANDTAGRKAVPLIARGLAMVGIVAAAALPIAVPIGTHLVQAPAIAAPDPQSPDGPSHAPGSAPAPKRHLWCMVTGGGGRGISYSKVCWYRTY